MRQLVILSARLGFHGLSDQVKRRSREGTCARARPCICRTSGELVCNAREGDDSPSFPLLSSWTILSMNHRL